MTPQRDTFIQALYEKAVLDKDIIFISADMGAPTLDQWKENLPEQFIAAGISEQNAINIAAGLAKEGKKVFVYMMASWFARCIEQVRYSCAMANNNITILGNGVALGYAPSGPAHEPNEDIALSRSLLNIEVYSPSNTHSTYSLVDLCLYQPKLRYIRLERSFAKEMADVNYVSNETVKLVSSNASDSAQKVVILSSGFMLGRAFKLQESLSNSYDVSLVDLWRIKPLDNETLLGVLKGKTHLISIEEQSLDGGFGSAICEFVCDNNLKLSVKRFGLPDNYIFENGTRDYLIDTNSLSLKTLISESVNFLSNE